MLLLQQLIGLLLIFIAYGDDCPIFFIPPEVVVEYEAQFSVNCTTGMTDDFGLSWNGYNDTENTNLIVKSVDIVKDWEMQLTCYIHSNETQCSQNLPVIIYKTPDRVSIIPVDPNRPMMEGNQYELQCDVLNVAPAQFLTVKWYKGSTLVNQTNFSDDTKTPVNKTVTLLIHPNRADDGAQYSCEAELDLGEEGPQPPPKVTSDPLNINVNFTSNPVDTGCPLQFTPQRVVVEFGGSVSVTCSTSVPHEMMGWEASEGDAGRTEKGNLVTWSLSELTEWGIKPSCFLNYEKPCVVPLPLTIYKTPDRVSIIPVNPNGSMMEGNQYELQCDVLNVAPAQFLTVKWYKGSTLVDQTNFTDTIKTPVNKSVTLLIRPNRADDGAQYSCEAELKLGAEGPQPPPKVTSDPFNITVYYKPQNNLCKDWSPKIGTSLVLYPDLNSVKGNPPPEISWRRKSSLLNASVPLNTNDSDRYEITASNELGNATCIINITVEYPPELNCNESYDVKEKTPFKHSCVAEGQPKPDLSLYKNGTIIQLPYYPTRNDGGWYQLNASNRHGTKNFKFFLNILYAPVFHGSQEKFSVEENSNIILECNSTGNPEPDMWWSFNKKNISTGRRHITFNIERATSATAGVYTCSATNEYGRNDKNFVVEIRGNSTNYIAIFVPLAVALLIFIIVCFICARKRKKSTGSYNVQLELSKRGLLSNGGESLH